MSRAEEPARSAVDTWPGATVLEFGAPWCGHCQAAQPVISEALRGRPSVRHVRIEDGSGRKLGRTFGIKLWPTLVFLKDGLEVQRLVRPTASSEISAALATIETIDSPSD